MKKLLLLLLCVPLLFSCGEEIENALTTSNIKGKVKEIIETSFDAKESFGEPQKENIQSKIKTKYNEDGNATEMISYNEDGEIESKSNCKYDEFDKIKNWIVKSEYTDDKLTTIIEREIEYYE